MGDFRYDYPGDREYELHISRQGELETAAYELCREIYGPLCMDRAAEAVRLLVPKYVRDWRLMDNEREFVRLTALEELEVSGVAVQWWWEEADAEMERAA